MYPVPVVFFLLALEAPYLVGGIVGRCNYNLVLLWTREIGHAPFASPPLIADVNLDGQPEVIAAPFTDQVTIIRGDNGHNLPNTRWPQQLTDTSVHASPLVYDIDGDGLLEVIITTSDGQILFFNPDGTLLTDWSFKLPGLQIARNWSMEQVTVDRVDIHSYILDQPPEDDKAADGFVVVDPHVLATPVIADLNADDQIEEMIIPVSYYFGQEYYSDEQKQQKRGLLPGDVSHYLAGSIVYFNLTSGKILRTTHLELTKVDAEFPGYVMFNPTVVDLDGNHGPLEVVMGTSAGQIHIIDANGQTRAGWPVARDSIHGQVRAVGRQRAGGLEGQILVADIDLDGELEIVAMDTSSNLMCYHSNAKLVWETQVSGSSTTGPRVADINQDGILDIVMGTNDGQVWVIEARTGKVMNQWPFRVGKSLTSTPLITRLSLNSALDVVILADDAHLHIVSGDGKKCRHAISLGETSLVSILSYDLVPTLPGMELLVATRDGTLMCLGRREPEVISRSNVVMDGLPAETRSANDFMYSSSKRGIVIRDSVAGILDVTGSWMSLHFTITDEFNVRGTRPTYKVKVYFGRQLLISSMYDSPGTYYLTVPAPWRPTRGHLQVVMTTRHGIIYQDSAALQFNMLFLNDLQWLLVCPFVAMAVVLLLLHGYPAVDLLPVTQTSKKR